MQWRNFQQKPPNKQQTTEERNPPVLQEVRIGEVPVEAYRYSDCMYVYDLS